MKFLSVAIINKLCRSCSCAYLRLFTAPTNKWACDRWLVLCSTPLGATFFSGSLRLSADACFTRALWSYTVKVKKKKKNSLWGPSVEKWGIKNWRETPESRLESFTQTSKNMNVKLNLRSRNLAVEAVRIWMRVRIAIDFNITQT